jgi:hypothetical protein
VDDKVYSSNLEFFRFLCYYAMWGSFKATFRDYVSVPSSRVKISKKMHLVHLDPWR